MTGDVTNVKYDVLELGKYTADYIWIDLSELFGSQTARKKRTPLS